MRPDKKTALLVPCVLGVVPVVWLGLLIAPAVSGGLRSIIQQFPAIMDAPFRISFCEDSVKTVLVFLFVYGMGIGVCLSSRRNYRRREEHGAAKWGDARSIVKRYQARRFEDNKLLTQNFRMGLDGRKHRRNLNTLVCGGSGAGKTRFYAKPNLYQASGKVSYVCLDPNG